MPEVSVVQIHLGIQNICRFIMNTKDLEILERAKKQFRMEFVSDIEKVDHAVVDSSTRLGYFIVTTKDYGKVEEVLFGNNK